MMGKQLYYQRFRQAQKTTIKYLRLLFNDHFVIFLFIAFGAGVLGYREVMHRANYQFLWHSDWTCLLIAVLLCFGLQFGQLITYFKPADRLYLLGNDHMVSRDYLQQAVNVSFVFAILWQLVAISLILPILFKMQLLTAVKLASLSLFLFSYKYSLLLLAREKLLMKPRLFINGFVQGLLRTIVPIVIIWLILVIGDGGLIIFSLVWVICVVVLAMFLHVNDKQSQQLAIDWLTSIAQAQVHERRILHFYATFADVPTQTYQVKRRKYLDYFLNRLTKRRDMMYSLYLLRLARGTELLSLILRLTIVGGLLIAALSTAPKWVILSIAGLMLYLVAFQLLPLFRETEQKKWTQIMPISIQSRQRAFRQLNRHLMIMVGGVFVLSAISQGWLMMSYILGVLVIIGVALERIYLPKQLKMKRKL
ncbi:UNVERIFIED_ORG: ABC-2 type transport system permease protein [Leuconostoc holzapfelii]